MQAQEGSAATQLRDVVSHFVLRLAFCSSEDNRRWLLAQETELFRYRYSSLRAPEKVLFFPVLTRRLPECLLTRATTTSLGENRSHIPVLQCQPATLTKGVSMVVPSTIFIPSHSVWPPPTTVGAQTASAKQPPARSNRRPRSRLRCL